MQVDVYKGGLKLETSSLSWVLDKECKLDCWSKLASLLSHYKYDFHSNNIKEYVGLVEHSVNDLCELLKSCDEYDDDVKTRLLFISEQFALLLAIDRLTLLGLMDGECYCGLAFCTIFQHAVTVQANTFLNNYCKRANDTQHLLKNEKTMRKLATFHK